MCSEMRRPKRAERCIVPPEAHPNFNDHSKFAPLPRTANISVAIVSDADRTAQVVAQKSAIDSSGEQSFFTAQSAVHEDQESDKDSNDMIFNSEALSDESSDRRGSGIAESCGSDFGFEEIEVASVSP